MNESALWEQWVRCSGAVWDLFKRGAEGVILEPLGARAQAVGVIVGRSLQVDNYQMRKLAYGLVGYAAEVEPTLLASCLESERQRRRDMGDDPLELAYLQSAVEDVVLAAARWCEGDARRAAGMRFLRDFVELVLEGEYWNTVSYAMATLVFHRQPGHRAVLARFAQFAATSPAAGYQEKDFATHLTAGAKTAVESIHQLLRDKDALASAVELGPDWQTLLDGLLSAASRS